MTQFSGKLAVVTGGGAGMGRELALQLAKEGCDLALSDVSEANLAETKRLCESEGQTGVVVSTQFCDVADEAQVLAFAESVKTSHGTESINYLFNNAGICGGGSFVNDSRNECERCFNINWYGVYYNTRAFLPMLKISDEGHIVNTSSINAIWATAGGIPHTAYATSKFAVKGFSEGLVSDLRRHAPNIKVSVVMPGYVGTDLFKNTMKIASIGGKEDSEKPDMTSVRTQWGNVGVPVDEMADEQLLVYLAERGEEFANSAPMTAEQAASIILDGVRNEVWRILVGDDAQLLDPLIRETPEKAYDPEFIHKAKEIGAWTAW